MTPGLNRVFRRSAMLFWMAGILPVLTGLAAAALEDVSFGHEHVAGGKVVYHHHFHLGAHEHPGASADDDDDDDQDHHDHHDQDHHDQDHHIPDHHGVPRKAATTAASPVLFQPLDAGTVSVKPVSSISVLPTLPAPGALRSTARPADSRGPPFSVAVSDSLDSPTRS